MTSNHDSPAVNRFAVAGGLRELADFIERHIDFPLPLIVEISYPVIRETDEQERDEVDRIATLLGVTATSAYDDHHYTVTGYFGPVAYRATCITEEYMRRHRAKTAPIDVITTEEWPI